MKFSQQPWRNSGFTDPSENTRSLLLIVLQSLLRGGFHELDFVISPPVPSSAYLIYFLEHMLQFDPQGLMMPRSPSGSLTESRRTTDHPHILPAILRYT